MKIISAILFNLSMPVFIYFGAIKEIERVE